MLSNDINVNIRFQRSTRIDSDLDKNGNFFNGFVFHGTAENTLRTIAEGYQQSDRKTYTVTGPYGTGKSTIALLLAGLLSSQNKLRTVANKVVGEEFSELFNDKFEINKGWFIVKAVCSFESPIEALWSAFNSEAEFHDLNIKSIAPPTDEKSFFEGFHKITKIVEKRFDGMVILFDEMGKSLEYLNSKGLDLQFFQDFAEKSTRKSLPVIFVGFLHQAFSEYARGQSQSTKDSWAKVQGRYTDLLFNVSEDETVTLIGNSIVQDTKYQVNDIVVKQTLDSIADTNIASSQNIDIKLKAALPLHPFTSLLLGPLSKRRFSQNERSTFGFLSSNENFGFQFFLQNNELADLYRLNDLYDYIEANLDHLILSSPDARAWSEAKDAVERTQTKTKGLIEELIKSIAILNMFARKLSIYSTKSVLHAVLEQYKPEKIDAALDQLKESKVVIYRAHLQSYAVFEGSDIDIDEELEQERKKLSTSDEWKTYLSNKSDYVVAKGHYHEMGVLRWMKLVFETGVFEQKKFEKQHKLNSTEYSVFVLLVTGDDDIAKIYSTKFSNYVFGIAPKVIDQLKYLINDLISLDNIARHNPIIQHDRIARRELESRISLTKLNFDKFYAQLFDTAEWYKNKKKVSGLTLSQVASQVADELYPATPKLYNELINRAKPSGAAVGARKKLMMAMVNEYFTENLGIEGTPPEMAMYRSCLAHQKLHKLDIDGDFEFATPSLDPKASKAVKEQHQKVVDLWDQAISLIKKESESGVVNLKKIHELWSTKPFGLTDGLIPIWSLALLLSQTDNLAFYDNDVTNRFIYITGPDEEFVNKLIKEPESVGVRYFEVTGVKKSHINALNRVLSNDTSDKTALAVAQTFVSFVSKLSGWVKTTKQLSKPAIRFRNLALKADDPHKFLLEDLANELGTKTDEELIEKITNICEELKNKHNEMLKVFKANIDKLFATSFDQNFFARATSVEDYSSDYKLKTFAQRLTEFASVDTDRWVSNIISLLSGKAERNWNDQAVEKAEAELIVFVERFKQAEYFASEIGEVDESLLEKNHDIEINKVDEILKGLSLKEQQVILMKSLKALLGDKD